MRNEWKCLAALGLASWTGCTTEVVPTDAANIVEDAGAHDAAASTEDSGAMTDVGATADAHAPGDAGATTDAAVTLPAPIERNTITRFVDPCVSEPTEFGRYGAVTGYDRYEVANPAWPTPTPIAVSVLVPVGGASTHPVIFYGHAFGGSDWTRVQGLLEFMVSHDYIVVFTPYPTLGATVCERYDTLSGGIAAAVAQLGAGTGMDLTRVGYVGHSFGGGASPRLAREGLGTAGWGSNGAFIMPNAPWYTYRMTEADWAAIPEHTRLLLMVFRDDDTNDHRIAIQDIWSPYPNANREYLMLNSGTNGSCTQPADHVVPSTATAVNGLDTWGMWRHFEALAACTLRGNPGACNIIDGSAPLREQAMGTWLSDGSPVPLATRSDVPAPVAAESTYMFNLAGRLGCDGR